MKRIEEKVKDIVDVRLHATLSNFAIDPLQTLTGYHFTDVTADLMAKWITAASRITNGGGVGLALAGFRGVGKSHFLAAFGAMLAHPEYRSRVTDPLVSSASQNLIRKSYAVAFLRRGTHPTLFAELKDAIAPVIGSDPGSLSDSLNEILSRARESTGDLPLILLIDTAFERSSRVTRDDGAILSAIADIAESLGIFVGIALDDDIAGADGANSAISRSFLIDYLDQEHLYKIVDNHIFPKNSRMQPLLHEIYDHYRMAVPGFRWSAERFKSLYPLHPSIMEIAPFVRLYMHDFALLSFASEAGQRILGRPANSLIAPDEVFDKAEQDLRKVEALEAAFTAFDKINDLVVSKTPVMKRLQAKLILKGLFLFSLTDEGTTATEIGASMLIFDEFDPIATLQYVETLMSAFAASIPDQIRVTTDANGNRRYAFILDCKDDLKFALRSAAEIAPHEVAIRVLRKQMEERFTDCDFGQAADASGIGISDCVMTWRGGIRKGKIVWDPEHKSEHNLAGTLGLDWLVLVEQRDSALNRPPADSTLPVVSWVAAELREDEVMTIKRYHTLMTDHAIRTEFLEHLPAALQSHAVSIEKIFQRAYLDDGVMVINGFEYNLTHEARSASSQSQMFTIMLEALFEARFPLHPYFPETIRMKDVSTLVADLFGGGRPNLDEVQQLAERFGVPLGIVTKPNAFFVPAEPEVFRELPLVNEIFSAARLDQRDEFPLDEVFRSLSVAPFGLVREAAYLLLAAMVSCRLIEFVTSNGDRISHRSLDLKLIWEDIVGVAAPDGSGYSDERLVFWAMLLTGKSSFGSLTREDGRKAIVDALRIWHQQWKGNRLTERFDQVSDDLLNIKIWHLARTSMKAFRVVSDSISAVTDNSLAVEDCLQRIADAFSDSEVEFARLNDELSIVEDFVVGAGLREGINTWLALCEFTGDEQIDRLRLDVDSALRSSRHEPSGLSNVDLGNLWERFQKAYSVHFLAKHDSLLATPLLRDKLSEILGTDLWWEFSNLSDMPGFDAGFRTKTAKIIKQIRKFDCHHKTREILEKSPSCGCSFTLGKARQIEALPDDLWRTVNQGLMSFRATLRDSRLELIEQLARMSSFAGDESEGRLISELSEYLAGVQEFRRLSDPELRLIRLALSGSTAARAGGSGTKSQLPGGMSLAEASAEIHSLVESLPS